MTFTKLFSSITESTIWTEPDQVRLVWITMLAMADLRGRVWASIPGLANRARVPVDAAEDAVNRFLSPDKYSRTPDHEGRRIESIDGGWRLLNHAKYRQIRDEEVIKESKRKYINTRREIERVEKNENVDRVSNAVDRSRDNAEAYTDSEAEAENKNTSPKARYRKEAESLLRVLIEVSGKSYRMVPSHLDAICQRLAEPDITQEGCERMIRAKAAQWKGSDFEQFLRPSTLFKRGKFSEYYDTASGEFPAFSCPNPRPAKSYDAPRNGL